MATRRFDNLRNEKKEKIIDAARKEFIRVPMEKVSINRIIKDAGISRGSFYTYFTDKKDLMEYLLSDAAAVMKKVCLDRLEENHGDFFQMVEDVFGMFMDYLEREENHQLYRSLFVNSEIFEYLLRSGDFNLDKQTAIKLHFLEFYSRIYIDERYNLDEKIEQFGFLIEITFFLVIRILGQYCFSEIGREQAVKILHEKIKIMKCMVFQFENK